MNPDSSGIEPELHRPFCLSTHFLPQKSTRIGTDFFYPRSSVVDLVTIQRA